MPSNEYKSLQVGMLITDNDDILAPQNYCQILEFGRNGQLRLQPMDERGNKAEAHPFWIDRRDVVITEKMYPSEYHEMANPLI